MWDLVLDIDGDSELARLQMLATIQPPIFDHVWLDVYHDIWPREYYGFALYRRASQCLIDFVARHFTQFPHLEIIEESPPTDERATYGQLVGTTWKWRLVVLEIVRIKHACSRNIFLPDYIHTCNHCKEADASI